jgi:hypothetical protein
MTSPSGTTALFLNVLESGIYCWPIPKARDIDRFVAMKERSKTRHRMKQEPSLHSVLRMGRPSSEEVGDGGLATLGEHQR